MDTKKIKNFLYYNWIKIAVVIFLIILIAVTINQCSSQVETDFGILYAGESAVSDTLPGLGNEIQAKADMTDSDGDGIITVKTKSIPIPSTPELVVEQQVMEQIQLEVISGENTLYILNRDILENYAMDETFLDITDYSEEYGYTADNTLRLPDNSVYAISLEDNELLAKLNIPADGMYIAVRNYMEEDKNEPLNINAVTAMKYILGK